MTHNTPTPEDVGLVSPRVLVTLKSGKEFYLSDKWQDIEPKFTGTASFRASRVVSMQPTPVVINPAHVALAEKIGD